MTQQNAAASEEIATTAEETEKQAESLKQLISYFKLEKVADNKNVDVLTKRAEDLLSTIADIKGVEKSKVKDEITQKSNVESKNISGTKLDLSSNNDDDFEEF